MMSNKILISILILFSFCSYLNVSTQSIRSGIRPQIQHIVNKLNEENMLHLGLPVGYAGRPETNNKYYRAYKKLNAKATNEELVLLTANHTKTIVMYSYLILSERNYQGIKEIFLNHLQDTSDVWLAAGCTGAVEKVNFWMLRQLNPEHPEAGNVYLTKDEYASYFNLVNNRKN